MKNFVYSEGFLKETILSLGFFQDASKEFCIRDTIDGTRRIFLDQASSLAKDCVPGDPSWGWQDLVKIKSLAVKG